MRALELHASAKIIQRSKGRSSVAAAAYRAGVRLYDERTGLTHDYTNKIGVELSRIYLPDNAPEQLRDRETLWNAVEKKENRSNSCTARELEVAFPYEFNVMQRREAGDGISRELIHRYGCAVDIAFHEPDKKGDGRNYHAHILFTDRGFDSTTKDGWAKNKYRDLSNDKIILDGEKTTRGIQEILLLREFTAGVMNHIAKRDDLSVTVEHLSFEARGIDREPQIHLGSVANDMERKGNSTERGKQNREIIDLNKKRGNLEVSKYDEFSGTQRSEFQLWRWDNEVEDERRCEAEKRRLEKELDKYYGNRDRKYIADIKIIEDRLKEKGLKANIRRLKGDNVGDNKKLEALKKSITSSEWRKKEKREALELKQKQRRVDLDKRHIQAEKELEEEIAKARSSFKEGESDGKGDDGMPRISIGKVRNKVRRAREKALENNHSSTTTGENKLEPRNKEESLLLNKAQEQAREERKKRTTSYSGKDIKNAPNQRLKSKHKDAVEKTEKSRKRQGRSKSERDVTLPRGPSLGR